MCVSVKQTLTKRHTHGVFVVYTTKQQIGSPLQPLIATEKCSNDFSTFSFSLYEWWWWYGKIVLSINVMCAWGMAWATGKRWENKNNRTTQEMILNTILVND